MFLIVKENAKCKKVEFFCKGLYLKINNLYFLWHVHWLFLTTWQQSAQSKVDQKTLSCLIFSLMILTCKEKSWIWSSHQCWKVPTIGLVRRCLLWWPRAVARLKEITTPDTLNPIFNPKFFWRQKMGIIISGLKEITS